MHYSNNHTFWILKKMSLKTADTWQRHLAFGGCLTQGKVTDWAIKKISNYISPSSSGKDPLDNPIISLFFFTVFSLLLHVLGHRGFNAKYGQF